MASTVTSLENQNPYRDLENQEHTTLAEERTSSVANTALRSHQFTRSREYDKTLWCLFGCAIVSMVSIVALAALLGRYFPEQNR